MTEITFYEDSVYPVNMSKLEPYDRTKLQLDFNSASAISAVKRSNILAGTPTSGALLQSPDLMLLKLGSPELENMIMQNNGFITTTPTPTDSRMPNKNATEEQEQFAAGFVLALQKLQQSGEDKPTVVNRSQIAYTFGRPTTQNFNRAAAYSGYDVNGNVSVKQEVPDSNVTVTTGLSNISFPRTQSWVNRTRPVSVITSEASHSQSQGQSPSGQDTRSRSLYTQEPSLTQRLRHPNGDQLSVVRHAQTKTGLIRQMQPSSSGALAESASSSPIPSRNIPSGAYPVISSVGSVMKSSGQQPQMFKIEDEAQIVPSNTPPLQSTTPIDLKMQEVIKHERKKLRNRLAAQRCRKRKIEREDELKIKVKELKTDNSELTTTRSELKKLVIELKQKVMNHVNEGCHVYLPNSQVVVSGEEGSPFSVS